ncbi:RodZ domain-containing protein [Marinobacter sp.]|uniref:RodZ domain-containing protein n=1 Tax=Marinobacter sp. TaxID=50741 RepID=UPI003568AC2D
MTTDNAKQESRQPGVGERLRKAREAAGLTVTEVADRQHLRPAVISAIENGDYRQIDSELFLKGYVRTYASQVGLDPESVIRQLDRELEPLREEQKARVEANPLITIERRKRRKRQIARIVVVLVILAAVFYGASLYLARQQATTSDSPAEPAEAPAGEEETVIPEESGDEADDGLTDDTSPEGGDQDLASLSDNLSGPEDTTIEDTAPEPVVETRAMADGGAGSGDGGGPSASATGSEITVASMDDGEEPAVRSEPLDQSTPTMDVTEEGRLQVEFSGDCWIEVQDGSGQTLEASLRSAGDTLELTGEPPLRVVLGAVSGVQSVRYSGETVDLTDRRVRNNRLVLNLP